MYSKSFKIGIDEVYRLEADPRRFFLKTIADGERNISIALTPFTQDRVPEDDEWLELFHKTGGWLKLFNAHSCHHGYVWFKDGDRQGDAEIDIISDTPIEVELK